LSPILGIWASAQQGASLANSYESIETVSLTSVTPSITFSSIPSTYKHLQIRIFSAGDQNTNVRLQFNGDTGSNYAFHGMQAGPGYGGSIYTNSGLGQTSIMLFDQQLNNSTYFNSSIVDILEYSSSSKNKVTRTFSGVQNNTTGFIYFESGLWNNTTAVNSITIRPVSFNFYDKSVFALYGIKG
jgi:hypothetical protein